MMDEPDIVKQLREEERVGKLHYKNFDLKGKIFEIIGFKSKEIYYDESDDVINSYKDALDLARKVLKDINEY